MVSLGARFGGLRYIVSGEGTDLTMIGVIANAQVVELADTGDLKSPGQMRLCGFESRPGHCCYSPSRCNAPSKSDDTKCCL